MLNASNRTIGHFVVGIGGPSGVLSDIRLIFQTALKCNATAIIACHNHPSGQLKANQSDKNMTERLKKAGTLLEIQLLDHMIITKNGYYSFADEGEL